MSSSLKAADHAMLRLPTLRSSLRKPLPAKTLATNLNPSSLVLFKGSSPEEPPNRHEADKKANLGEMVEILKHRTPRLLRDSFPEEIILPNIILRVLPSRHSQLRALIPKIDTRKKYFAAVSTIQTIVTSTVLSSSAKLHILSLRVTTDPDYLCVSRDANKIHIRWTTADSFQPEEKHEPRKMLDFSDFSAASPTKVLMGFAKDSNAPERVLLGIFVFELNEDNNVIVAHTIEDVELIERKEPEGVDPKLRVC